ncbi:hypothetical protein QBC39DRAFT_148883 [Podospora conica]|nr:hypothetical protein QBC39DRAFT_148883 [Schizothecium conicum]
MLGTKKRAPLLARGGSSTRGAILASATRSREESRTRSFPSAKPWRGPFVSGVDEERESLPHLIEFRRRRMPSPSCRRRHRSGWCGVLNSRRGGGFIYSAWRQGRKGASHRAVPFIHQRTPQNSNTSRDHTRQVRSLAWWVGCRLQRGGQQPRQNKHPGCGLESLSLPSHFIFQLGFPWVHIIPRMSCTPACVRVDATAGKWVPRSPREQH